MPLPRAGLLLVVAGFGLVGCVRPRVKTLTDFTIAVTVTCSAEAATVSVSPSRIELNDTQRPVWTLSSSSNASEIFINRTLSSGWPYGGKRPYEGKKDKPAKTDGNIDKFPSGTRKEYHYTVAATCEDQTGPIKSIKIDPDLIIIWN